MDVVKLKDTSKHQAGRGESDELTIVIASGANDVIVEGEAARFKGHCLSPPM